MIMKNRVVGLIMCGAAVALVAGGVRMAAQGAGSSGSQVVAKVDLKEIGLVGGVSASKLTFNPGTKGNNHTHTGRTSIITVVQGTFIEHRGDTTKTYNVGDTFTVANGESHWAENSGTVPLIYVEVNISGAPPAPTAAGK
jgi:quercetin dioxygenase-like cupin family protein